MSRHGTCSPAGRALLIGCERLPIRLHFTSIQLTDYYTIYGQRETATLAIPMNNTPEASQLMLLSQLSSAYPGTKVRFLGWFVHFSIFSISFSFPDFHTQAWTSTTARQQPSISKIALLQLLCRRLRGLPASMSRMFLMR
jgi:hypothetical protein